LQPHEKVSNLNFAFKENPSLWYPFFSPTMFWSDWLSSKLPSWIPIGKSEIYQMLHNRRETIQLKHLKYTPIQPSAASRLEEEIQQQVNSNFLQWRRINVANFNRYVGKQLKKALKKFEQAKQNNELVTEEKHNESLQEVLQSYQLIGFPLNFSYTNTKSILEEVKNTLIHEIEDTESAFALGVYVHPYVNNVFSVWVYITALISR